MLIPSIDLQRGRIVQLEQGERLALETDDFAGWIERFSRFPKIQLIDLDAAMDDGANRTLMGSICKRFPCRVGGGIRTIERAREVLVAGAASVIVGTSLFRDGKPDLAFAAQLAEAIGVHRLIGAVDSRGGHVVVHGWKAALPLTAVEAVRALEPFCGEFLYTHVDTEGLLGGIDLQAVLAVRDATTRPLSAAGGIRSRDEVCRLADFKIDAVVGMALYKGVLDPATM